MLKNIVFMDKPEEDELKERLKKAREKLFGLQMQIKDHKVPVLVLVEGWGTAGKGSLIGNLIQNIDPRFFKVAPMEDAPDEEEKRKRHMGKGMEERRTEEETLAGGGCFWMFGIFGRLDDSKNNARAENGRY